MKRVLIVEDHAGFRQALAKIFKWNTELEDDVQASTLAEGRRRIGQLDGIEVAVIDLGLPDGDGSELIKELRAAEPDVPVVVLTNSTDTERHARAVDAGAERVLTKEVSMEEILEAVRGYDSL